MGLMVEFQAEIRSIADTEVFASGFQKRSMIVKLLGEKENADYPTWLTIEAKKDKVVEFDQYGSGMVVDCKCFLSGNLWEPTDGRPTKAFVGLDLWEMKTAEGSPQAQQAPPSSKAPDVPQFDDGMDIGGSELPF